jgi:hypothetical protein
MPPSVPPIASSNKNTMVSSEVVSASTPVTKTMGTPSSNRIPTSTTKNRYDITTTKVPSTLRESNNNTARLNNTSITTTSDTPMEEHNGIVGTATTTDRKSSENQQTRTTAYNPITSYTSGTMDPSSLNPYYGSTSSGNIPGYAGMYSPYSSYGMMGSTTPYYGGYNTPTSPFGMPGLGHPGITNLLFNFQSIVFSLGQTIQVRT